MTTRIRLVSYISPGVTKTIGDFIVDSASYDRGINEAGSFDFSLPISSLPGRRLPLKGDDPLYGSSLYNMEASLYLDGEHLISGMVTSVGVDRSKDEIVYKFSCDGELAQLGRMRAKSNATYQDTKVVAILTELLDFGGGYWKIGDMTSMEDVMVTTTIDLRGEKHLLPQIRKLIESAPNLYFRYGGASGDYKFIDIGAFNVENDDLILPDEIVDLAQDINYSNIISLMEPYGGEIELVGVKSKISLADALIYDPNIATDFPPFTVSGTPTVITNTDISPYVGEQSVEYFSEIVPVDKIDPTLTEIGEAGYALFLKVYGIMFESSEYEDKWKAVLKVLPTGLKVGEQVFLRANARQVFYDYVTNKTSSIDVGQVAQWYRVNGYSTQIKDNGVTYNLEIATNFRLTKKDPLVELYESVSQTSQADDTLPVSTRLFDVLSVDIPTGLDANAFNYKDGITYPGRRATIPVVSIPLGKTSAQVVDLLYTSPFTQDEDRVVRLDSADSGVIAGGEFQVVATINGGWLNTFSTTVYLIVEYV